VEFHAPIVPGYRILEAGTANLVQSIYYGIYYALNIATDTFVDLTVLSRPTDTEPARWQSTLAQYRSLLQAQEQLKENRNIQRVQDYGEIGDTFYIVQEHIEGRSLREILVAYGPRRIEWLLPLISQVAIALDYAASYNLNHTALSPDQILISTDGENAYIRNFTLARFQRRKASPYTAPEQLGRSSDQSRTDMYSLGAILYEALSGKPPFTGATESEVCHNILNLVPWPLLDQPIYLRQIIGHMMARLPESRYRTFIDVTNDLQFQRSPAAVKPEKSHGVTIEQVQANLKAHDLTTEEIVLSPPTTVTGSGLLTLRLQSLWHSLFGGHGRNSSAAVRADRSAQGAPRAAGLWAMIGALLPLGLWRGQAADWAPTENPGAMRRRGMWYRLGRFLSVLIRRVAIAAMVLFVAAALHAALLLNQQRYAVVKEVNGRVSVRTIGPNGKPGPAATLHAGDCLSAEKLPVITTDKNSTVTLEMPGAQLKLAPDASVQIDHLDYGNGAERKFDLTRGQVWAELTAPPVGADQFEIRSGDAAVQEAGTVCTVTAIPGGLKAVAARGPLQVSNGFSRKQIVADHEIDVRPQHRLAQSVTLTIAQRQHLAQQIANLEADGSGWLSHLSAAYQSEQMRTLEPLVARGLTLAHLRPSEQKRIDDARALVIANYTLQGLSKALVLDGEPVSSLNLHTIAETGLDAEDRRRILDSFADSQVLYYKKHGDGYTAYVRANDSTRTLLRSESGKITHIREEDEDRALSNLLPQ
jgi:hypothetical protein